MIWRLFVTIVCSDTLAEKQFQAVESDFETLWKQDGKSPLLLLFFLICEWRIPSFLHSKSDDTVNNYFSQNLIFQLKSYSLNTIKVTVIEVINFPVCLIFMVYSRPIYVTCIRIRLQVVIIITITIFFMFYFQYIWWFADITLW